MQNFENIGRELERRGKTEDIKHIAESEDGMRVSRMVDAREVEAAAKSGDSEAIRRILGNVLKTEEGKRLAESVQRLFNE